MAYSVLCVQAWTALEFELFRQEVPIPVYFAWEDGDLSELYHILTTTAEREKDSSVVSSKLSCCAAEQSVDKWSVGDLHLLS